MSWTTAISTKTLKPKATAPLAPPIVIETAKIDWDRLVSLDFETYYDEQYTLKKLSTSEYVRDERFEALMLGLKVGRKKTRIIPGPKIKAELAKINWKTHSLLAHNVQFDGFILSTHYGIVPAKYYDTLGMARGLHSNEVGADLDSVSIFYGGAGKTESGTEDFKGLRFKDLFADKAKWNNASVYCANDVDEMYRIFTEMVPHYPADEIDLIHMTARMFCDPVLKVDIPRVQAEYDREVAHRKQLMLGSVDLSKYDIKDLLKKKAERELPDEERQMLMVKRVIGSNERFTQLLIDAGVPEDAIPRKVSPAWIKRSPAEKEATLDEKYVYAYAKDDLDFTSLPDRVWDIRTDLDPNDVNDVIKADAMAVRWQQLIDVRISVKSTTNITRAARFLEAGRDGYSLPVGYAYYRAHTGRWGGNNKMNMQNLTRGGELRLSILAAPGHQIAVADSSQIEARTNAWLWDQMDLIAAFRDKRDIYSEFATAVYGRLITKNDKIERHVGKTCIAEGELVLTHRGLVPIHLVSLEDWLWDGVEWVQHDGVIDQGIKEVITYDGLTATPDHEVFTEDGRIIPFGQAASEMARLQKTGAGRANLRFCDDRVATTTSRQRLSVHQGQMRSDRYYQADIAEQLAAQEDDFVPQKRAAPNPACKSARSSIRCNPGALYGPPQQRVGELRSAGRQTHVQVAHGVHSVGNDKSSAPGLQGCGDRPSRQQRPLPARQPTASYAPRAEPQQAQHPQTSLGWSADSDPRVSEPIQPQLDQQTGAPRADRRADTCKARVYDIANAGPRKRFTVSNTLVLNCVLGLGYQMGAAKLQMTLAKGALGGPKIALPIDECHRIVNLYRRQNYKISAGWQTCATWIEHMANPNLEPIRYKCLEIGYQYIQLPNGMRLKYPDLRKARGDKGWDEWSYQSGEMRKKIYGGLLCENLVQALARIIVATQMLAIDTKYRVVMTTHDEAVTHPKAKDAAKCFAWMEKCMTTPPAWCADLPVMCEGGWDTNYSK